jgi:hypothetical protein
MERLIVGVVFLVDLIVLVDLARAELSDLRTAHMDKRGNAPTREYRSPTT